MRDLTLHEELIRQDMEQQNRAELHRLGLDHLADSVRYVVRHVGGERLARLNQRSPGASQAQVRRCIVIRNNL